MSVRNIGSPPDFTAAALPATPVAASEQAAARRQAPTAEGQPASKVTAEQIQAATSKIQKLLSLTDQNLQFSVDDETGKTIVSITDGNSGELIRQIPSEELVEIAKSIGRIQGLLVNSQA